MMPRSFQDMSIDIARLRWLRAAFMAITAIYLASCYTDADVLFGRDGWINTTRVGSFLETADLQSQARWYLSPLWWTDSLSVHYACLAVGIGLAIAVTSNQAPSWLTWLVWLTVVAIANRYMMLASIAESWLSMSLFGLAIASSSRSQSWWTGFGIGWLKIQFTVLGIATTLSMWSQETWRMGTGAVAMTQPASERAIDWTESGLTETLVHDAVSVYLLAAIPIGLWLVWTNRCRFGVVVLTAWALLIATLGSHFLHAALFVANACAFLISAQTQPRYDDTTAVSTRI